MMNKQYAEALATAAKSKDNVKIIRNTAENGADYYIKPYEDTVIVYNSGAYTQNLFLPRVGESVGMVLSIVIPDFGGGGTIADNDDSIADWSDLTNDADNEYAILFNTGRGWISLASDM